MSLRSLRLLSIVAVIALSACESADLDSQEQAITDCLPAYQYGWVPTPTIKPYDGTIPPSSASTVFVVMRDNQNPGNFVAWQVDLSTQQIPWARRIPAGKLGPFTDQTLLASTYIRYPPQPNPPPPPIVEGRDLLEIAFRAHEAEVNSLEIIQTN